MNLSPAIILARELAVARVRELRRYPLNTVASVGTGLFFFFLFLVGGQVAAGQEFGSRVEAFIVGYFLFSMTIPAFRTLASRFSRESRQGTLEQLYVTPFGFSTVSVTLVVLTLFETVAWGIVTLAVMVLVTDAQLLLDPITVVSLSLLTIAPVAGVGFVFGGLAVVYKRVAATFSLLQYSFVAFLLLPAEQYPVLRLLPITDGKYLLVKAMTEGYYVWELSIGLLFGLVSKAVLSIAIGIAVFRWIVGIARKRGVLGHY